MKIYHKNGSIKKIEFCCDEMATYVIDLYHCMIDDNRFMIGGQYTDECPHCNTIIEIEETE